MNELLLGLLGALLATNQVVAISNVVAQRTGIVLPVVDPNDPVEKEYQSLLAADDAAQAEVDRWIQQNETFEAQGADYSTITLNARIEQRFEPVVKAYTEFIQRHPGHARVRLAYGSFLNDIGRDAEAMEQWEKARELEPNNPAAWNNLADFYSHRGPVRKAFDYLAKAIELNPREPVYHQNLAIIVFLFRQDAREIYGLPDDQAVFRRALEHYRTARSLDPENFTLATDLAQVYYYLKPAKPDDPAAAAKVEKEFVDEGIQCWLDAQKVARTNLDREGVSIHLARFCLTHGRFEEARRYLAAVSEPALADLKKRVTRNLDEREKDAPDPAPPAK